MSRYSQKQTLKMDSYGIQLDQESSKLSTDICGCLWNLTCSRMFSAEVKPRCWRSWRNLQGTSGTSKDKAMENHNATLLKLLERCRERNLKLNREKLQLKCTGTAFIGHVQTPEGIKPDPRMVEAVLKMWCGSSPKTGRLSQLLVKKVSKQTFKVVWTTKMTHP